MPGMLPAVPHRFYNPRLLGIEHLLSATHPATCSRRGETGHRALANQLFLKLRQRCKEVEDQPACGCAGVEPFLEGDEVDAALIEAVHDLQEVADRSAQAVQPPHDQGVTPFQTLQTPLQLGAVHGPAAHRLLIDSLAARLPQLGQLRLRLLLLGRDSGIANHHRGKLSQTVLKDGLFVTTVLLSFLYRNDQQMAGAADAVTNVRL